MQQLLVRVVAMGFLSYMGYYFLFGTKQEMIRAIKIVYYLFNLLENITALHL